MWQDRAIFKCHHLPEGGGEGGGEGRSRNIQNFFLTDEQIIKKFSNNMKATIFSSDYLSPPTQTVSKKINLDVIQTLIYISENEVGNLPGNWVLGEWDC